MIITYPQTDEGVRVSLQVIGIVGFTVSVVFLLITIITFIAFRYCVPTETVLLVDILCYFL